jgi:hypothetical protein
MEVSRFEFRVSTRAPDLEPETWNVKLPKTKGGKLSAYCPTRTASITIPMFLAPAERQRSISLTTSP